MGSNECWTTINKFNQVKLVQICCILYSLYEASVYVNVIRFLRLYETMHNPPWASFRSGVSNLKGPAGRMKINFLNCVLKINLFGKIDLFFLSNLHFSDVRGPHVWDPWFRSKANDSCIKLTIVNGVSVCDFHGCRTFA